MFSGGVMSTTQRHLSDKLHQWMLFQIMIKGYKWFWHSRNIKLLFVIILDEWIGHINKHAYATIERHVAETKEGITKGCNILGWYIGLVATVAKKRRRPHQSDELLKLDHGIKPVLISSIYCEGYSISYGGCFQWYHLNRRPHQSIIAGNSNDDIGSLNEALKYSEVVIRSRFALPKDEILPVIIEVEQFAAVLDVKVKKWCPTYTGVLSVYHLWYNTCCIKLLNVYFYVLEEHFSICKILHLIGFNSNKDEMLPDELDGTLLIYCFITAFCISNVWSFDKKFSEKSLDLIDICEPKCSHSGLKRG